MNTYDPSYDITYIHMDTLPGWQDPQTPSPSTVNIPDAQDDPSGVNYEAPQPAAAATVVEPDPQTPSTSESQVMTTVERVPLAVRAVATLTAQSYDEANAELSRLGSVTVSPSAQARVAQAYAELPELPEPGDAHAVRAAWDAFAAEIRAQAQTLVAMGFHIESVDVDPYESAADMFADVSRFRIRVLSTKITGSHPYMSDQDNDLFRAVHDVLGHAATGRGFDRHGEEAAYRSHAALFSRTARAALATETRGQNAALVHSQDGQTFDAQRLGILPAWARGVEALDPLPDERSAAVADAVQRHTAGGLRTEALTSRATDSTRRTPHTDVDAALTDERAVATSRTHDFRIGHDDQTHAQSLLASLAEM